MSSLLNKYFIIKENSVKNLQFDNEKNIFIFNKFFLVFFFKKIFKLNALIVKKDNFLISPLKNKNFYCYYNILYLKIWRSVLNLYCGYTYSRIFVKVGLGFRKKYSLKRKTFSMNIGRRKWVVFKLAPVSFFFNLKKRNLFLFVNSKRKLYFYLTHFKTLRKETMFKFKGILSLSRIFMTKRVSRSILFARRVKFRKIKLKLTKKQKQRK